MEATKEWGPPGIIVKYQWRIRRSGDRVSENIWWHMGKKDHHYFIFCIAG
jgi:hypothetical protein